MSSIKQCKPGQVWSLDLGTTGCAAIHAAANPVETTVDDILTNRLRYLNEECMRIVNLRARLSNSALELPASVFRDVAKHL